MNNPVMITKMKVMHGVHNTDFYSLKLTWLQLLLSARSASSRDEHRVPQMTLFPGAKTTMYELHNTSSTPWYSTQHCFCQGTGFLARELWQWSLTYGIHWSYHVLHHPETSGLIKCWNGPLRQLQLHLAVLYRVVWVSDIPPGIYVFKIKMSPALVVCGGGSMEPLRNNEM